MTVLHKEACSSNSGAEIRDGFASWDHGKKVYIICLKTLARFLKGRFGVQDKSYLLDRIQIDETRELRHL